MTREEFLALVAGGQQGSLLLWTKQTKAHRRFSTADVAAAAVYAREEAAEGRDVYVRSNVQDDCGTTADTLRAMTVVSLDFDVAGAGHKAGNLPTSPDQLEPLLRAAGVPEPTITLLTGGGVLAVWSLAEPVLDVDRAKRLSQRFQGSIRQAAGFHIDSTHDLVRPLRIPQTRNWKEAYGPCGAEVAVRTYSGRRLQIEELERVAAVCASPKSAPAVATIRGRHEEMPSRSPEWEAIYQGCDALRAWADVADGLAEPAWYALANVLAYCRSGRAIFHDLSKEDRRYDAGETDGKLDQAREASKPRTCENVEALGGDCGRCPFRGRINSPIALGYANDPVIPALARRWVYIASRNAFVDLQKLEAAE